MRDDVGLASITPCSDKPRYGVNTNEPHLIYPTIAIGTVSIRYYICLRFAEGLRIYNLPMSTIRFPTTLFLPFPPPEVCILVSIVSPYLDRPMLCRILGISANAPGLYNLFYLLELLVLFLFIAKMPNVA